MGLIAGPVKKKPQKLAFEERRAAGLQYHRLHRTAGHKLENR